MLAARWTAVGVSLVVYGLATATEAEPPSARFAALAATSPESRVVSPPDLDRLRAEDVVRDRTPGLPRRFAAPIETRIDLDGAGSWDPLADGSSVWRLRVASPGARTVNLGITTFALPPGGTLWLYDPARTRLEGPYGPSPTGELWTPAFVGDEVVVEVHLPAGTRDEAALEIGFVNHGYRDLDDGRADLLGSCSVDVACPEGDDWRAQARAVARYTIAGTFVCTGTLINTTDLDFTPYVLSANHCGVDASNASTLVLYWNFESPTCGQQGGGSLDQNQSGATFRAAHDSSDFLLVELLAAPPAEFGVWYAGWNAAAVLPSSGVGIHHPFGSEKAISVDVDAPLVIDTPLGLGVPVLPGSHLRTEWEVGNTEGGSSGSCLFDPASGACVGVLSTGTGSCFTRNTTYGRLNGAWQGGGTPATRLRDWLDPGGTGALSVGGADPNVNVVGHWPFDENAGSTAADAARGNDGTITGATWTDGVLGSALSFDGDNDWVEVPHAVDFELGQAMTIEAWVRKDPTQGDTQATIVDKSHGGPGNNTKEFALESAVDDESVVFVAGNGDSFFQAGSGVVLNDDQWHLLAATLSVEDGLLQFFVDGTKTEEAPFSGSLASNDKPLYFGRWWRSQGRFFTGAIDEVRLYDGSLTLDELRAHFDRGVAQCLPTVAGDLRLERDGASGVTTLSHAPAASAHPTPVVYDTIRSGDPTDFVGSAVCVGPADEPGLSIQETLDPLPGGLFHYLVRAENGCPFAGGQGPLGRDGDGTPRTARSCP